MRSDPGVDSGGLVAAGWLDFGDPSAPAVIALHGFPETAEAWAGVARGLAAAGYRVVVPRQRGYTTAFRPPGRARYRVELLSRDVLALMDHLGLRRAHIAGHDLGASVAWDLGMWHPERVNTVFSIGAPHPAAFLRSLLGGGQAARAWHFLFAQLPMVPELCYSPARERSRSRLADFLAASGLPHRDSAPYLDHLARDSLFSGAVDWYRAMPLTPPGRLLRRCAVPAFVVWGDADRFTVRRAIELTPRYVDAPTRSTIVAGGCHWLLDASGPDVLRAMLAGLGESAPTLAAAGNA
jgi:pimeloyl-ACP methyl ester carboxylesterase